MGDKITLNIQAREVHGKKVAQLRREGLVPAVVYGPGIEPMSVQVDEIELTKAIREAGKSTPVHLTGSKRRIAMIKEVDIDPSKNAIRHVSFHAVRADEPVTTEVTIRLVGEGESEAEKAGLIVLQTLDKIEIKALPMELPEALEVSIVELKEEGDRVTVGDIKIPAGVELIERTDGRAEDDEEERPSITDLVIASVYEPSALQAANDAAGGDAEDESEVEAENGGEEDEATAEGEASSEEKS